MRHRSVFVGCIVTLVLAATAESGAAGTATPPTTKPNYGLVAAPNGVSTRLELVGSHTIVAGTTRHGTLVVSNRTGAELDLTELAPNHCTPRFAVALTNRKHPPNVAFTAMCGTGPFIVKRGTSRLPFTVSSSVPGCTTGPASPWAPQCLPGPRAPDLPPGHYKVVLVGDSALALPEPKPIKVTVRG
jgi:hypothetical protein